MTNGHISSKKAPGVKEESRQRKAQGVPDNAAQKLAGSRRASGADTPSGPNTDRTGGRAKNEIKKSIKKEGGNSLCSCSVILTANGVLTAP